MKQKGLTFSILIALTLVLGLFGGNTGLARAQRGVNSPDWNVNITVKSILIPDTDSGRFNLKIDNNVFPFHFQKSNVGNNGILGPKTVYYCTDGRCVYTISETAGTNAETGLPTDMSLYTTTYQCTKNSDVIASGSGTSFEITATDSTSIVCTFTNIRRTTAVAFSEAEAIAGRDNVTVKWQTAQEIDVIGFNVYRSNSPDGTKTLLNNSTIASQVPGGIGGADYQYVDANVQAGNTYYYWIQTDETSGSSFYAESLPATVNFFLMMPIVVR